MQEAGFWLAFSYVRGIGAVRFRKLLSFFGDLSRAWQAGSAELLAAGLSEKNVADILEKRKTLDPLALPDQLSARGIAFLTWQGDTYPRYLKEIAQPPPVLFYKGSITAADDLAVAIVGTRNVTAYGKQITRDTAEYLAQNGVTVVSGLARGVDGLAHHAAIEAGGRTIAVLGSGVDVIYPPEHRRLAEQIQEQGAIVSDYAPGTKPDGINFPPRNRIISGLSRATIVIEAGEKSGALITAKFAVEQDREVFAVPGSVLSPMSRGTNDLIGEGAMPMTNPKSVLEALRIEEGSKAPKPQEQALTDLERTVLRILGQDSLHIDEICVRMDLSVEKLTVTLTMMELKGLVVREQGMTYRQNARWM
ncbi:MAG TPA: DNA-processing protein DprA [Anaerolineaceae bacterium]|nr:DNA-processing protein DprA [Anaerolineaceae bacterium]